MSPREAFRVFMRFVLIEAIDEGKVDLKPAQIDTFIDGAEDDVTFYDELYDFLGDYIDTFGGNYGAF